MYSPKIVQKRLEKAEKALKTTFKRYSVEESKAKTAEIAKNPQNLNDFDAKFVRNEQILCKFDFRYWAERYCTIALDPVMGGGMGTLMVWKSQELGLQVIGKQEEKCYEQAERGEPVDGICAVGHKARQLGFTMLSRALCIHRLTLWKNMRAMAASVDDDKIQELYDRDKTIYDNLPFFLKPSIGFDVKSEHIYFDKMASRILYQQSRQQSGLGQGRQFDLGHLTECAFWPDPRMIEFDFFPTLPQGPNTLCLLESTANGRGNWWHEFTNEVRKGFHRRWVYIFSPWYVEEKKYRAAVPAGWTPSEVTLQHAKKVYETSREFVGRDVLLPREQLYWYETERDSAIRRGSLNLFLTNYCATPEESFQHTTQAQFSVETLERIRLATYKPFYYNIALDGRPL